MTVNLTNVRYTGPALPGNAEEIVLFSSVTAFGLDAAPHYQTSWVDVSISLDENTDNTVELQKSADGSTWITVATATISDANASNEASFFVAPHRNWRLLYTNGTTPQTAFMCEIVLDADDRANNA